MGAAEGAAAAAEVRNGAAGRPLTSSLQPSPPTPARPPARQSIIKSYRAACALAVELIKGQAVSLEGRSDAEKRDLLRKCAMTSMNSKLARSLFELS